MYNTEVNKVTEQKNLCGYPVQYAVCSARYSSILSSSAPGFRQIVDSLFGLFSSI